MNQRWAGLHFFRRGPSVDRQMSTRPARAPSSILKTKTRPAHLCYEQFLFKETFPTHTGLFDISQWTRNTKENKESNQELYEDENSEQYETMQTSSDHHRYYSKTQIHDRVPGITPDPWTVSILPVFSLSSPSGRWNCFMLFRNARTNEGTRWASHVNVTASFFVP